MGQDLKEISAIIIFILLIVLGIQWLLLRYTHWAIALMVSTAIVFFIVFYGVSLGHASPNGGSSGPKSSVFLWPLFLSFIGVLGSLGVIGYLSQKPLPSTLYILSVAAAALFATGKYTITYIENIRHESQWFSYCDIELVNYQDLNNMKIKEILFKNTSNGAESYIKTLSKQKPYPCILRSANKIAFRIKTLHSDILKTKEFPFDYSLCREQDGPSMGLCFWIRQKKVLPLKILLGPNDIVKLYIGGNLAAQYDLGANEQPTHNFNN